MAFQKQKKESKHKPKLYQAYPPKTPQTLKKRNRNELGIEKYKTNKKFFNLKHHGQFSLQDKPNKQLQMFFSSFLSITIFYC